MYAVQRISDFGILNDAILGRSTVLGQVNIENKINNGGEY